MNNEQSRGLLTAADAANIMRLLAAEYPDAAPQLTFSSAYELCVAVVLSAQCTDTRVNAVTSELFKQANTPAAMLALGEARLGAIIAPCGLWRTKAAHIIAASRSIVERFAGEVPDKLDELTSLEGVGQKSASVIRSVWFGIPAIAVDTHVFRVARRCGLASGTTPTHVQRELMDILPEDGWSHAHHLLIFHGRRICHARRPECDICAIKDICLKQI